MRGPDGTDYPLMGVYREISPHSRIVTSVDVSAHPQAWFDLIEPGRDRLRGRPRYDLWWTVTFEPLGSRTRLTIVTHFPSRLLRDAFVKRGMNQGWGESLDKLADVLRRATAGRARAGASE